MCVFDDIDNKKKINVHGSKDQVMLKTWLGYNNFLVVFFSSSFLKGSKEWGREYESKNGNGKKQQQQLLEEEKKIGMNIQ